jgi:3',5'-cyclic-AMP phosphodiesterase
VPIQLLPVTRRRFLAAATASLLGVRGIRAAPLADEHAWALLADPHIDGDRTAVSRGVKMADHLAAAVREVLGLPTRPANVLVNGDCAFKLGLPGDYRTFTSLLTPLREAGLPVHLTLGNHDDRRAFRAALETGPVPERPVPNRNVAVIRRPRANLVLLDSLDVVDKAPGKLGDAQLAWLARTLDANADKPAIVVAHHNLSEAKPDGALIDTKALLDVIAPRKQVKAYVFGHTHVWAVKEHASGIHLVNLPAVAYPFQQGQPTGWVHGALAETGATLTMHSLDKTHKANGQVVELTWRKG